MVDQTNLYDIRALGSWIWGDHWDALHWRILTYESIQTQFLLFALRHQYNPNDYMKLPTYDICLNTIDLETLKSRRNNSSAIFIFNILNGNINSEELENHVKLNNKRTTRISNK
jgi:hypothetical protein